MSGFSKGMITNGAEGNDTITGGAGNDVIIGGAGTDTAFYSGSLNGRRPHTKRLDGNL